MEALGSWFLLASPADDPAEAEEKDGKEVAMKN
jgi:hypothetical protein